MVINRRGIGMTSQRARDRLVAQLREMGIRSEVVLEQVRQIPRHLFVDEALASRAYENSALPIGHGQTISQPYIVARMTEAALANGRRFSRVLEVGGGCGYQAAILASLATWVYSIERIEALARRMRENLRALKINNVTVRHGDGTAGWVRHAPYDAIIVAAAPMGLPDSLTEQLAPGGRLVIPVGGQGKQELLLVSRDPSGFIEERLSWVSFVPMLQGVD
jgi:protein-L-isoaspartate(D-aspartate) O-methyltransferase